MALEFPSSYTVELCDDYGKVLKQIDTFYNLKYTKTVNATGWFSLETKPVDDKLLGVDHFVKIWRNRPNADPRGWCAFPFLPVNAAPIGI